jgi:hypothetical protein
VHTEETDQTAAAERRQRGRRSFDPWMFNERGALDIELVRARTMSEAEGQLSRRTFVIMLLDLGLKLGKN